MSFWKILVIVAICVFIGAGLFSIWKEKKGLDKENKALEAELSGLLVENKELEEEIRYYKDEENLLKEAKSQFNYRAPDEKLFIIVPEAATGSNKDVRRP